MWCEVHRAHRMASQAARSEGPDSPLCMPDEDVERETQVMHVPLPESETQHGDESGTQQGFVCLPADDITPPAEIQDLSLLPMMAKLSLGDGGANTGSSITTEVELEHNHAETRRRAPTPQQNVFKPRSIPWNQMSPNERRFPWIHKKTCPLRARLTSTGSGSSQDDMSNGDGSLKSKERTNSSSTNESSESSTREKEEMQKILDNKGIVM